MLDLLLTVYSSYALTTTTADSLAIRLGLDYEYTNQILSTALYVYSLHYPAP